MFIEIIAFLYLLNNCLYNKIHNIGVGVKVFTPELVT